MFNKSFTCKVTTDADGKFKTSTPVENPSLFAIHVNVQATLQSPPETRVTGTFAISPAPPRDFSVMTDETVDLGKWQVAKHTNTAIAIGETNPARPNTELVVQFDANL